MSDKEVEAEGSNLLNSSSSLDNDLTEICIEGEDLENPSSVTNVLNYCKTKIVNPYLRFLSLMGLRPIFSEQREQHFFLRLLSYGYLFQVLAFMIIGYFLQYMTCFRRDRGFGHIPQKHYQNEFKTIEINAIYEKTCNGTVVVFSFIIPSVLHLVAYLHALIVFRRSDDDQLPVLMERVFLSSTNLSDGFTSQRKLVKSLWMFVIFSILWMGSSFAILNYMLAVEDIEFKWTQNSSHGVVLLLKILLVVCVLWHDIVQATIISNYCLQAQLLTSYIQFMREKILQYRVQPMKWMRDMEDFRKLLNFFNEEIAPPVSLFIIVNLSYAISGILWLLDFDRIDKDTSTIFGLSLLNVCLWVFISVAPIIQAARLSKSCENFKAVGQEVRTRPFIHEETTVQELDSILIYTISLSINAKLFGMPIIGRYFSFTLAVIAIVWLVLGQCHYLIR